MVTSDKYLTIKLQPYRLVPGLGACRRTPATPEIAPTPGLHPTMHLCGIWALLNVYRAILSDLGDLI